MDHSLFDVLETQQCGQCILWSDQPSGLRAILALDNLTLGPAAGGIRTWSYPTTAAALRDVTNLARAMTRKNALAGLNAGGGKAVVLAHPGLDRPAAFARLGQFIEELGGRFYTSGDLGTTAADLQIMARHCQYVHTDTNLAAASARGLLRCIEACAEVADKAGVAGLRIAVQGCGDIGTAVARTLAAAGAALIVADIDRARAKAVAAETGARVVAVDNILTADCDIVCPCALGGVLTEAVVAKIQAWAVCGAANNIVADAAAEQQLVARGIWHVPDIVASAGAVIQGVCAVIMHNTDADKLIDVLGTTARDVMLESRRTGRPATAIANERAWRRIRSHQTAKERAEE